MTIALIWAQTAAGIVGADGRIPWRLPADQAIFKAVTVGRTVVMGRRTWDSLPASVRPLPGRRNLVLTRTLGWAAAGAEALADPAQLDPAQLDPARFDPAQLDRRADAAPGTGGSGASGGMGDVWVIGGGAVWAAFLPVATVALVTTVDVEVPGDVYAPVLPATWRQRHEIALPIQDGVGATVRLMIRGRETAFAKDVQNVLRRSVALA